MKSHKMASDKSRLKPKFARPKSGMKADGQMHGYMDGGAVHKGGGMMGGGSVKKKKDHYGM